MMTETSREKFDRSDDVRQLLEGHEWHGGYYCECGHLLNSPRGYIQHIADVLMKRNVDDRA
jgi:hypothetical protein